MQQLTAPQKNMFFTDRLIIVLIFMLTGLVFVGGFSYARLTQKSQVSDPEYLHGCTIDIPEELTAVGEKWVPMEAMKKGNIIYLQFKHNSHE